MSSTMRIDDEVRAALAVITGEAQARAADASVNTVTALKAFIAKYRPDIMELAKEKVAMDAAEQEGSRA